MKTVLITGCSSGFGLSMVETLLRDGHRVIATLRNAESRLEIFEKLQADYSERLIVKSLDVTDASQRESLLSYLKDSESAKLDVLINNAGVGYFGSIEDMSEAQIRNQMELNFIAPCLLIKEFLPLLRNNKGMVVNITSIMGQYSMPLGALYSASKYALEGLTEGLFHELNLKGVDCVTIAPGGHRTNFLSSVVWAENAHNSASAYKSITQAFIGFMNKLADRPKAPDSNAVSSVVSDLVKRKAKSKSIPREIVVGKDAFLVVILKRILPKSIYYWLMNRSYRMMLRSS